MTSSKDHGYNSSASMNSLLSLLQQQHDDENNDDTAMVPNPDAERRQNEERLAEMAAQMEEMHLRHEEETRQMKSRMERMERRNRELELRFEAQRQDSTPRAEMDAVNDDSNADSSELQKRLLATNAKVLILTSQLDEVQRRSDDTQSLLETKLERALKEQFALKIEHATHVTALQRDMAELREDQEAEEWALAARQSFTMAMERDHRKDEMSVLRSKMNRELREKVELIESLREALAVRDRNIEALTHDLEDARGHIRRMGGMNRRGSALEGCNRNRETELFGQLHQALGVPNTPSPARANASQEGTTPEQQELQQPSEAEHDVVPGGSVSAPGEPQINAVANRTA